jgi:hypothetical protein
MLKGWVEFLEVRQVPVFADRPRLRDVLSLYAEHRLSGELEAWLSPASWNLAVKTLSAFYQWAVGRGASAGGPVHVCPAVPISARRHAG